MWEMKSSDETQKDPLKDVVETHDGWNLAVYRYRHRSKSHPVLLVHGLGTNRFDVDFPDPRYSLAKYLHRRGFDTWIVELRGAGSSRKKKWASQAMTYLKSDWT